MKTSITTCFFLFINAFLFSQTSWYVNQSTGSNSNNGTSPSAPFQTVEKAGEMVQAGDTIFIMGEYVNDSYDAAYSFSGDINDPHIWTQENTIRLNNLNGSAGQYITFKAYNSSTVLKGDGANIFRITNCSYLRIEGFDIQGEVDNIPLSTALALQFLYREENSTNTLYRVPPGTTEEEIDMMTFPVLDNISRPSYTDTRGLYASNCHHLDIINNVVHHTPGNGLRVANSDYVNIIGNEVHNTSRKSYSGTHGLVASNMDSYDTNTGYKIFITHNLVHHNYNEIYSWAPSKTIITTHIDEGKGISLQRNDANYTWTHGRILVANNITYWNGYSGLHANGARGIDFINNTAYKNFYTAVVTYGDPTPGGNLGISFQAGDDVKIINNIAYTDTGVGNAIAAANTVNLTVSDNLVFGNIDSDVDAVDVNTTFADPLFVDASLGDFNLENTSPAIGIANAGQAPSDDFFGNMRDANPDLGAVEYLSPLAVEWLSFAAYKWKEHSVKLQWTTISEQDVDYFIVEKSKDGMRWERKKKISAKGGISRPANYSAIDLDPFDGLNYYRIREVDFNGTYSFSPIKSVVLKNDFLKIYPNPATHHVFIESEKYIHGEMKVYNSTGQDVSGLVRLSTVSGNKTVLYVGDLPGGKYFIQTGVGSFSFFKK